MVLGKFCVSKSSTSRNIMKFDFGGYPLTFYLSLKKVVIPFVLFSFCFVLCFENYQSLQQVWLSLQIPQSFTITQVKRSPVDISASSNKHYRIIHLCSPVCLFFKSKIISSVGKTGKQIKIVKMIVVMTQH